MTAIDRDMLKRFVDLGDRYLRFLMPLSISYAIARQLKKMLDDLDFNDSAKQYYVT
jgi:hypothetical protein